MANTQMEPWNNYWAELSQGMANSQIEPWNNYWAELSQGMANSWSKLDIWLVNFWERELENVPKESQQTTYL